AGALVAAVCATSVADVNRRGNQQYAAGDYPAALELYRTAQAMAPERDEAFHNAANALHQQGDYAAAIEELRKAFPVEEELAGAIEYALGKHFAADGQLQEAYEAFKRSLLADPDDQQAKHNLEVILKLLRPTPSPTPTLAPETPPPGSILTTPQPSPGAGDPGSSPGGTAEPAGTPEPGGTPGPQQPQPRDPRELSDQELQEELDEALSGIEREYSEEEARRALELLEERNRRLFEEQTQPPGGGLPDY
ncbi:MAG TPA: tetratricopeptide repeat protein, partial [Dehalococcoidia bacterium]|nr:tetratricopeptide repeat protein [Dehalococcoidia bacterium]